MTRVGYGGQHRTRSGGWAHSPQNIFLLLLLVLLAGCAAPRPVTKTVIPPAAVPSVFLPPMPDGSTPRIASGKIAPAVVIVPVLTKTLVSWENKSGAIYTVQASTNTSASWFTVASNTVSPVEFNCWSEGALVRVGARPVELSNNSVNLGWSYSQRYSYCPCGFNVYQGAASRVYTNKLSAGTNLNLTVTRLVGGVEYFFAVTAYDTNGLESIPSSEASYTVPVPDLFISNLSIRKIP